MALLKSSERTGGFDPKKAKSRNSRNIEDAKKVILGPMPVQSFMDAFMENSFPEQKKDYMRTPSKAFNRVPVCGEKASDITEPLLLALNSTTKYKSRCPGFLFENTSARIRHPGRLSSMKPDICCFSSQHHGAVRSSSTRSRIELGYAALFFEIKPDPKQDFFCDPPPDAGPDARDNHQFILNIDDDDTKENAERALGQHIAYVTEICARQHRTFCFSISMSGSCARLIRWDRAGAIVTESFDIRKHPGHLCEFLWRFSQASELQRGYDTTVYTASEAEEVIFREAITAHVKLQLEVDGDELEEAVREHYKPGVVSVIPIAVGHKDDHHVRRRFLASRPVVSPLWPFGRGTRGYWVVDPEDQQVGFLKDTWRYEGEEDDREGNVIERLNAQDVCFVPPLVCHGDVPNHFLGEDEESERDDNLQYSITHKYESSRWVCGSKQRKISVSKHDHYRLVEGVAGYSLKRFKGTEELLHATYDVFQAMIDTSTKDNRIHRDISLGNIILVKDPGSRVRRGYLVDWEASCKIDAEGKACESGRTGTWQFMSCKALLDENVVHSLSDDMESLLYVVLYCSLIWLPNQDTRQSLTQRIHNLFNRSMVLGGRTLGGAGKHAQLSTRTLTQRLTWTNPLIQQWLDTVMEYRSPLEKPAIIVYPEKWSDPKHLDTFWCDFLTSHTLEANDRIERDLLDVSLDSEPTDSNTVPSTVPSAKWEALEASIQDVAPERLMSRKGPATFSKSIATRQEANSKKRTSSGDRASAPLKKSRDEPGLADAPIQAKKKGSSRASRKRRH
ncbi:hypothetical protein A0H81_08861 [Grifola frondosa]|uniref:Fungal-type protein kinase domain-containing protein n=1 Tax=Grifola frondosa TaxID=5627 RepID=A0A1C7M4L3_GRIFR|nr:hypothetical protein A0H81_08861 [Grifola frondosa]